MEISLPLTRCGFLVLRLHAETKNFVLEKDSSFVLVILSMQEQWQCHAIFHSHALHELAR